MPEFTQEELSFISQVLTQLPWKAGQSGGVIMSESIIKKCSESMEQKPIKKED